MYALKYFLLQGDNPIECFTLQGFPRKRATHYRALLQKIKDVGARYHMGLRQTVAMIHHSECSHILTAWQRLEPPPPPPPNVLWADDGMQWKSFCDDVVKAMADNPDELGQNLGTTLISNGHTHTDTHTRTHACMCFFCADVGALFVLIDFFVF